MYNIILFFYGKLLYFVVKYYNLWYDILILGITTFCGKL